MAVVGWFIAFAGALALHPLIYEFCPAQHQVSGLCSHPWAFMAEDLLVAAAAFVSAVFAVSFATRTAPRFKSQVASVVLIIGLLAAIWAYLETDASGALLGAFCGGFMTTMLIVRRHGWRTASNFRQYELFI
jgi:hypothetical protein